MAALDEQLGQPHRVASQSISETIQGPSVRNGDTEAFVLRVLGYQNKVEQEGWSCKVEPTSFNS